MSVYASEEQFILSQVALLEQVEALVPMLDSAHIKGTSPLFCLERWVDGQDFPVPQVPWVQASSAPCLYF